eukprot:TRINITY_DN11976_c0_g1_i10.p1 TRINITY_DN11976_c0_g1~~TRINITY_DN11976_c0_g1_i10.p1  ORF type:complete len:305 (+),score=50.03 TRINITY_DN11976_c0_g1_i10:993-1907(+)
MANLLLVGAQQLKRVYGTVYYVGVRQGQLNVNISEKFPDNTLESMQTVEDLQKSIQAGVLVPLSNEPTNFILLLNEIDSSMHMIFVRKDEVTGDIKSWSQYRLEEAAVPLLQLPNDIMFRSTRLTRVDQRHIRNHIHWWTRLIYQTGWHLKAAGAAKDQMNAGKTMKKCRSRLGLDDAVHPLVAIDPLALVEAINALMTERLVPDDEAVLAVIHGCILLVKTLPGHSSPFIRLMNASKALFDIVLLAYQHWQGPRVVNEDEWACELMLEEKAYDDGFVLMPETMLQDWKRAVMYHAPDMIDILP